jgi:phage-related protein
MLPTLINTIVTTIFDNLPLIIDAGIQIIIALIGGIIQSIPQILEAIDSVVIHLILTLAAKIQDFVKKGNEFIKGIWDGFVAWAGNFAQNVLDWVNGIISKVTGWFKGIKETGTNLVKGLWEGISDAAAWIWDKISSFCSGILDKIKGFFGIHSPSTVFADLGENMGKGLGIGFVDTMDAVADEMIKAVPMDFDIDAAINTGSLIAQGYDMEGITRSGGGSSSTTNAPIINVYVTGVVQSEYELAIQIEAALERAKYSDIQGYAV